MQRRTTTAEREARTLASAAVGHDNAGTPFATNKDNNEGKYGAEPHVMRSKNRDIAAKAGTQDFGEATYASNIAANTVNMAESKARNSRSTGAGPAACALTVHASMRTPPPARHTRQH